VGGAECTVVLLEQGYIDVCKGYCYWSLVREWPVKKQLTHGREEMIKR